MVQERGRSEILLDYNLRVGQITHDTEVPAGQAIIKQRLDETEIGVGTTISLIDAEWPAASGDALNAIEISKYLGLPPEDAGLIGWDVFDAVLTPGDVILLMIWKAKEDAGAFTKTNMLPRGGRLRHVRVIRDYGMFDRREAPQHYASVKCQEGKHRRSAK
jgi:hypothetical protein